jgi:hypothetical protein
MASTPLLKIGTAIMPTPSKLSVGVMDLSKAERSSKGKMIIERIATKKKLQISYSYLTGSQLSTLLQALAPTYYDVTYLDPVSNSFKTASFYCGDRNVDMVSFVDNVPKYENVSFDLIER